MGLNEKGFERLLLLTIGLSPLVYSPRFWDPSVFPKMAFVTISIFIFIPFLVQSITRRWKSDIRIKSISLLFISLFGLGIISTILSNDLYAALFGVTSRNNGFLGFHTNLLFLLVGISLTQKNVVTKLLWVISGVGLIETLIAAAQKHGFILIIAKNPYSPLIGTFGNPNYLSAYLGFSTLALLLLIFIEKRTWLRILLTVNLGCSLLIILWSQSIQGLFMFGIGSAFLLTKWINTRFSKKLTLLWGLILFGISVTSIYGLLNKGPLKSFLFQDSTFYRLDYWRAAIRMIIAHPFFGVGPDQYQHAYIFYRDASSVARESNIISDSAHNMYLQIGSTYGIIYFAVFIIAIIYTTILGFRAPSKNSDGKWNMDGLSVVAIWIAFLFQAAISVDTVSALSVGFLFGGLIFITAKREDLQLTNAPKAKKSSSQIRVRFPTVVLSGAVGVLTLLAPYTSLHYLSYIRDKYSAPGTQISLSEINHGLGFPSIFGHGDRYLWSRVATFRYGSGDVPGTQALLDQLESFFPNYPTIKDYQAQLAANDNRFESALKYRQEIFSIDHFNIPNLKELILLSKKLNRRDLYNQYIRTGKTINLSFFSSPDLAWPN